MSARTRPPFRADHVGSLLRPERLHKARADYKAGTIDLDELRGVEDECILEVIQLQRDAGLQTVTDGELRRTSWHMDFIYSLGGIEQVAGESLHVHFQDESGEYDYAPPAMKVAGKVTLHATSHFEGIILSQTGITLQTGASLHGRAWAQSMIALDNNIVAAP